MSANVIEIEHLGKCYRLGASPSYGRSLIETIGASFNGWLRPTATAAPAAAVDFWALRDVSLTIEEGDRVAVIGRNGAGKTTVLKILSRITAPTEGLVRIRGRVASLLEVGTGFHPELTGRENIFLNGAILGMSREEIRRKFDDIVGFSEIEKFVDTPVKRYSSGMYVRLAFSVAAHLEPDILIVDEVLAVGDVRFQEKCLGKMRSIGRQGRTVLFVTHQMGMVSQLCNRAVLLEAGSIREQGAPEAVVSAYLRSMRPQEAGRFERAAKELEGKKMAVTHLATLHPAGAEISEFAFDQPFVFHIRGMVQKFVPGVSLGVVVRDRLARKVFTSQIPLEAHGVHAAVHAFAAQMRVPAPFLAPGEYSFLVSLHVPNVEVLDQVSEVCPFRIVDTGSDMAIHEGADYGCVISPCTWKVEALRDAA
jgi:lipopolysaccharide transport system ATP-binding protein